MELVIFRPKDEITTRSSTMFVKPTGCNFSQNILYMKNIGLFIIDLGRGIFSVGKERYKGMFKDGKCHGRGLYTNTANNARKEGEWRHENVLILTCV